MLLFYIYTFILYIKFTVSNYYKNSFLQACYNYLYNIEIYK